MKGGLVSVCGAWRRWSLPLWANALSLSSFRLPPFLPPPYLLLAPAVITPSSPPSVPPPVHWQEAVFRLHPLDPKKDLPQNR